MRLVYLRSLFFLSVWSWYFHEQECPQDCSLVSAEEAFTIKSVGRRHLNALLMKVLKQEAPFKVDRKQLLSG